MNEKCTTWEKRDHQIDEDIRFLTENLIKSVRHCCTITDPAERESNLRILRLLKEDFEGYFTMYVEGCGPRSCEEPVSVFEKMLCYFGIEFDPALRAIM